MKQNYTKDLARKLCEELGIEWDETAAAPTLHGTEVTSESLKALFPQTSTWKHPHRSYSCRMEDSDKIGCLGKERIMIMGYSETETVYEQTDLAPLAA